MTGEKRSRIGSISIGLRAVLMLVAGLFAAIWPLQALAILVVMAGVIFLVDGVLGLWAVTFGGAKTGNFWFDVVRNALSIIMGFLILMSPILATLLTTTIIIWMVGAQAIIVGAMEIYLVTREREFYVRIWPMVLNGALYILFGLLLFFAPVAAASFFVILGGVLAVFFSFGLFGLAWHLYHKGF
ncbi:MAG: DUF308 domain-containing protein [Hyphomicrobiaceae bacterium]|nr:DUF308 domain-containing protein [Hyphomicrobiaceae bacterium]